MQSSWIHEISSVDFLADPSEKLQSEWFSAKANLTGPISFLGGERATVKC